MNARHHCLTHPQCSCVLCLLHAVLPARPVRLLSLIGLPQSALLLLTVSVLCHRQGSQLSAPATGCAGLNTDIIDIMSLSLASSHDVSRPCGNMCPALLLSFTWRVYQRTRYHQHVIYQGTRYNQHVIYRGTGTTSMSFTHVSLSETSSRQHLPSLAATSHQWQCHQLRTSSCCVEQAQAATCHRLCSFSGCVAVKQARAATLL